MTDLGFIVEVMGATCIGAVVGDAIGRTLWGYGLGHEHVKGLRDGWAGVKSQWKLAYEMDIKDWWKSIRSNIDDPVVEELGKKFDYCLAPYRMQPEPVQ